MKIEPVEMFKVFAVETRLEIIDLLRSKGTLGAKGIAEELGITPAAVSQHLKILRQAGLVRSARSGYWIPYSIDENAFEDCRRVLNRVCACGCCGSGASLEVLKRYERELQKETRSVQERISRMKHKRKK